MTAKRNFPNFIDGYLEYAKDKFCPDFFHLWTAISMVSGALERKVWVNQGLNVAYPNIYVLLVSHPGGGKSTAIERGVDFLEVFKDTQNPEFKIIPEQITEAALVDIMKIRNSMQIGSTTVFYSSGYFCASEASSSALQNLYGDFNATITRFYDCPKVFRKKTKGEREVVEINNLSFCVLAGSTFDYLKQLVNENSVMGGLASRFIYVVSDKRFVRESRWDEEAKLSSELRAKLIEDLTQINQLQGAFKADPGFRACWEKAIPEFDRYRNALDSERLESIMARKMTNLMKVAMIVSVSESNDLLLKEEHWHKAEELINSVTKDNSTIIKSAIIAKSETQQGLNLFILNEIEKAGGSLPATVLKKKIMTYGADVVKVEPTLNMMVSSGEIAIESDNGKVVYKILGKVESNL